MTRKKVKLEWISNDIARKASLKKRRVGLLKKVSELTVLCDVDAFCIIYSPDEDEPVVWPNPSTVQRLLIRYQDLPENERYKKMMNQESYLKERIGKAQDQSKKHQRKNKDMNLNCLMQQLHQGKDIGEFDLSEMHCFAWLIQEKKKDIKKRIDYFQQVHSFPPWPSTSYFVPSVGEICLPTKRINAKGGEDETVNPSNTFLWDQWLVDTVMNNENGDGCHNIESNIGLPYGVYNISCIGPSSGINMGIDSFYENVGGINNNNVFSMGFPNHGNFLKGGSNKNGNDLELPYNIEDNNDGGDTNGLRFSHSVLEGHDTNGVLLGMTRSINGNLRGNNERNEEVVDLGLPYRYCERGNDGRNFSNVEMPYNGMGGTISGRNWDGMGLPNKNLNGVENEIGLELHNGHVIENDGGINDWNNAIKIGLANNLNSSSGGTIVKGDVGFQNGFFGGASDIGLPYDQSYDMMISPSQITSLFKFQK